jgi:glycosyltransferase involved in cell wall biosynthesis
MTSISVVIPTLGKDEYLAYTLASLVRQTHRDFEVIVVNDGGESSTADLVAPYRKHFPLVYAEHPHGGRSTARNHGIRAASGERVVFIDDDRVATPDLLHRHAERPADLVAIGWKRRAATVWRSGDMLAAKAADMAALAERFPGRLDGPAATVRLIEPADLIDDYAAAAALIDLGDDRDNHRNIVHMFTPELDGFRLPWALVTTGNLSVDRQALVDVGGFDEGYMGWGIEDVDLGYRLHRRGLRTIVDTDAVNLHQLHPQGESSAVLSVRRRGAESLRNTQYFCRTHSTLEAYLYWQYITRKHSLLEVNQLLGELSTVRSPVVHAELLRLYETTLPPGSRNESASPNLYCAAAPIGS